MKLTENRLIVLRRLADSEDPLIAYDFRHDAPSHIRLKGEWAHPHLRWAIENGLVETCGSLRSSTLHKITEAGRAALSEARG